MKIWIFNFCFVRGFDVLEFESKPPGIPLIVLRAPDCQIALLNYRQVLLLVGTFTFQCVLSGRLGQNGHNANRLPSIQVLKFPSESGNVTVMTVQFIAG